jgi:hypothetical protein
MAYWRTLVFEMLASVFSGLEDFGLQELEPNTTMAKAKINLFILSNY